MHYSYIFAMGYNFLVQLILDTEPACLNQLKKIQKIKFYI